MLKWSLFGVGAAWAAGMLYEWMWTGMQSPWLLFSLAAGVFLAGVVFVQPLPKSLPSVRPMLWFSLAGIIVGLFWAALERTVTAQFTHVPMMPLYFILFLDFLASGCYTWWKKQKKKNRGGESRKWPWK